MGAIDDLLDGAGDTVSRRLGPLTVGQWALAGAAGWAIVTYGGRLLGGDSGPPTENEYDPYSYGADPYGGRPVDLDTGQDTDAGDGTAAYDWAVAATNLLDQRGWDRGQVWNALQRGISGASLTSAETEIWNAAIDAQGPPPPGTPYVVTDDPPEPTGDEPRDPAPGWGYAQGDSGRYYVVNWSQRVKHLVSGSRTGDAANIFGQAITQQSQAPYQHRNEQEQAEQSGQLPVTTGLNLNVAVLGWTEPGVWNREIGTVPA